MASEAAAKRREARVRKILGNMDDRLKKISGSQFVFNEPSATTTTYPIRLDTKVTEKCRFEENEPDIVKEVFTKPRLSEPEEAKSLLQKLAVDQLVHVAVLAVVTYALLRCHAGFLFNESVMVPFYTLVFGKQVFGNRRPGENPSLIFSLLSMYTANNKVTSTMIEVFSIVASTSRDFCLYLFIIILAAVLFGYNEI